MELIYFEIAATEIGDVVSGRKTKKICRNCWNKNSAKIVGGGKKSKRRTSRIKSQKKRSKTIRSLEDIFYKTK